MSIQIHHGAPGSYKTSGAIQDTFIPAVKELRTIVTNVRGLDNSQLIADELNLKAPVDLIHVDTTNEAGRLKMATWFHWVPKGSFILIDEINTIYPTDWRDTKLKEFDYAGGLDQSKIDQRPFSVKEAFEMHRHYNFDFCVTTPHINKVHPIIRQCAEGAYRHKNQAVIGLKGWYQEIFHMSDDNGKTVSSQIMIRQKRIKKHVFKLYSSTDTGQTKDTISGQNVFTQPAVLAFIFLFVGAVFYLVYTGPPEMVSNAVSSEETHTSDTVPAKVVNGLDIPASASKAVNDLADIDDYFKDYKIHYVGTFGYKPFPDDYFSLENEQASMVLTKKELKKLGYKIKAITDCLFKVTFQNNTRLVTCAMHEDSPDVSTSNISSQFKI